ncbi:hypothetical protein Tco_0763282, partial [Tanacetum coccineum]
RKKMDIEDDEEMDVDDDDGMDDPEVKERRLCAVLRDAATVPARDDDDSVAPKDPQPSKPRGSLRDLQ